MSFTVVQDKGVTVITVETDRTSMLPPLCQILKTLCFRWRSCSLFKRAEGLKQSRTVSALGTLQIMVGLFNIGLGPGRTSLHPGDFTHLGAAYWLGGVFLLSGIVSLLANRFPCPFSVGSAVLMNITGSVFALIGLHLYAIDIQDINSFPFCHRDGARTNAASCRYVAHSFRNMVTGMDVIMISLTVLQLVACISLTAVGVGALCKLWSKEEAGDDNPEKEALLTEPDSPPCRPMPYNTTAVLGTILIMAGLFNVGLGPWRISLHPDDFAYRGVAYYFSLFILAGFFSLCAAWYDNPWLVGSTVAVNILGCVLAVIGSMLYGVDMLDYFNKNFCDEFNGLDDCQSVASHLEDLMQCMDITMIVLGVVTLVVCITVTALGIRDLVYLGKRKKAGDDEIHQPETKGALLTEPGA